MTAHVQKYSTYYSLESIELAAEETVELLIQWKIRSTLDPEPSLSSRDGQIQTGPFLGTPLKLWLNPL